MAANLCPSCGAPNMEVFHEVYAVPVNSVLILGTKEEALGYPKGNITLGFCQACGFIANTSFNPEVLEYSSNCEESQGFSPTFNAFARRQARQLIDKYSLHDRDVIEIGCGKGEFLILLCELGRNKGVGFDPAYVSGRSGSEALNRITFIKDYYSEKYSNYHGDFICCRMTLEHIRDTRDLVSAVRNAIGTRLETIVFFQVPDVTRILRDCAFEDIYYEHCSYFSPGSLARLFRKCGFDILYLDSEYDGQYLTLEAKASTEMQQPALPLENDLERLKEYVDSFKEKYGQKTSHWKGFLQDLADKKQRVVLWGSGSKAVAFLTTLNVFGDVEYVVDINPYRQESYMAGTGQQIVAPEFLREYKPDVVLVMNAIYLEEIQNDLARMALKPKVLAL